MMRYVAGAAVLCILSVPTTAQEVCGARGSMLDALARDYQESPSAMGMSTGGDVVEVFTARSGKTWTILITRPDGNSCIVAAGELWTRIPQQVAAMDDTI